MLWSDLDYWQSGEYQVVQERWQDLVNAGKVINPAPKYMFRCLDHCPYDTVKVIIVGQDPYPEYRFAIGTAFSIPYHIAPEDFPPTLKNLFKEYCNDLHYDTPGNGDLLQWSQRGVLLWNAIPSCETGKSLSHDWNEYEDLTREIIEELSEKGNIVFVFLGAVARRYVKYVDTTRNAVIETSHPSPRGSISGRNPFLGSRIFTRINAQLVDYFKDPIDWKLTDAKGTT